MIHVRTWNGDSTTKEAPTVQVTMTGLQDLKKLQALLNRALNTVPEFGEDWFEFSDKLTEYLEKVSPPT